MPKPKRNQIIIKTSILGIVVNIVLVAFKAAVGFFVGSIAIILDATNNLTDAFSSIITIIGTKLSTKPPDKNHPYGYGRIEYFTTLIISLIVLSAGIFAIKESIEKIISPTEPEYNIISLIIIFVAVLAKIFIGTYVRRTGQKIKSGSLIASGQDALMDAILSAGTLISGILNLAFGLNLEGYLGALISVVIIKSAIEMISDAVNPMLGVRSDEELAKKLKRLVESFPEVQGAYDLNLHNYGPEKTVASIHIQVRNNMTAKEIHILTREIEYAVYYKLNIALTIGIYAANDDAKFHSIKQYLATLTSEYPDILQLHGFYVDEQKLTVYFDLVLDFNADASSIRRQITSKMKQKYPKYTYNIIIDTDTSIL